MNTEQKFLDNFNGLPVLWERIKNKFASKEDVPTDNKTLLNGAGYQTESNVRTIVETYGYQTAEQVSAAVTGQGYQTAAQVDAKIKSAVSSAVKYKGTVGSEDALPATPENGDMYNISVVSSYGPAGTNVVWNGNEWDAQSGTVAVEAMTAEEIQAICT